MSPTETSLAVTDSVPHPLSQVSPPAVPVAIRNVPFRLSISIPLSRLKLRDLRALRVGQVFPTETLAAEDVPVSVGGVPFAFAELDNVDGQMAVRLTRLS